MQCPCGSKKPYAVCCQPWHQGINAPNALALMRSRYSAYALGLADYIIATTHPLNPQFTSQAAQWTSDILAFCQNTKFLGLEIVDFKDGNQEAYVSFIATLEQGNKPFCLAEKSRFEKIAGKWLYRDAVLIQQ